MGQPFTLNTTAAGFAYALRGVQTLHHMATFSLSTEALGPCRVVAMAGLVDASGISNPGTVYSPNVLNNPVDYCTIDPSKIVRGVFVPFDIPGSVASQTGTINLGGLTVVATPSGPITLTEGIGGSVAGAEADVILDQSTGMYGTFRTDSSIGNPIFTLPPFNVTLSGAATLHGGNESILVRLAITAPSIFAPNAAGIVPSGRCFIGVLCDGATGVAGLHDIIIGAATRVGDYQGRSVNYS
jgi:hypothetical protein